MTPTTTSIYGAEDRWRVPSRSATYKAWFTPTSATPRALASYRPPPALYDAYGRAQLRDEAARREFSDHRLQCAGGMLAAAGDTAGRCRFRSLAIETEDLIPMRPTRLLHGDADHRSRGRHARPATGDVTSASAHERHAGDHRSVRSPPPLTISPRSSATRWPVGRARKYVRQYKHAEHRRLRQQPRRATTMPRNLPRAHGKSATTRCFIAITHHPSDAADVPLCHDASTMHLARTTQPRSIKSAAKAVPATPPRRAFSDRSPKIASFLEAIGRTRKASPSNNTPRTSIARWCTMRRRATSSGGWRRIATEMDPSRRSSACAKSTSLANQPREQWTSARDSTAPDRIDSSYALP